MTKLYFIGDTHFGRKYSYLQDYEMNISKRNYDVIENCEKIVEDAIANTADHVIFLGDVYDRKIVSPTIRKIVRKRIFDPLLKANIPVLIIGGNHDSSRNPRRGVDLEDLTSYPNVEVATEYQGKIIQSKGKKIGILCLPFIHYEILLSLAQREGYDIKEEDRTHSTAQTIVQTYISNVCQNELKDCDHRILIGHYYIKGSKFRETSNPNQIYGEFQLNEEMIQKKYFDLVMFGHVHLKQTLYDNDRIVILGSSDRINMGERDSEKYYAVYEPEEDGLEFKEIKCRSLLKTEIEVPNTTKDITQYVLQKLPKKSSVKDAVCQIYIKYTRGIHYNIDRTSIEEHFADAFYKTINYVEQSKEDLQHLREANLAPVNLFENFMNQKYHSNEHYSDMLTIGTELIEAQIRTTNVTEKGSLSIRSIDLQNFNKYGKGPNKITFEKDHYVITGPTGTGKSSILDAITFALFKRSSRREAGLTIDEILYENGYVELELGIGTNKIKVKRLQKAPKLQIEINGKFPYTGMSIPEKEKKLEEIIGYDYEGFISSFFIRQQELQIFSSLSPAERQKRLGKLFKLKIFQSMDKELKDKIDKAEKACNQLIGEISSDTEKASKLPETKKQLKEVHDGLKKITSEITKQKKIVKSTKETLQSLTEKMNDYNTVSEKIADLNKRKTDNKRNLESYKLKQTKYKKVQDQLKEFTDVSTELSGIRYKRDTLNKKLTQKNLFETKIENEEKSKKRIKENFNAQINRTLKKSKNEQSRLKSLSSNMTKDQAFNVLKETGALVERLTRINSIEIPLAKKYSDEEQTHQFELELTKTKKEIGEIENDQDKITEEVFIAEEIYKNIKEFKQEAIALDDKKNQEISEYDKKIRKLQKEMKSLKLTEDFDKKLRPLEAKLQKLEEKQSKKERLEKELATFQDFTALIQKTESDLIKIQQSLDEQVKSKKDLEPAYRQFNTIQTQLTKDEEILNGFLASKEGAKVSINMYNNEIKELQDLKKKIKQEDIKLSALEKEKTINTILRKKVFHSDGIPKFALEKILPAISIRASAILGDLTDGRLNKIAFVSDRYGFDIHVDDGDTEREASTFSGGEKTQINAAIRFSIMERIDEIPDTTGAIFRKSDTLFIDEGDLGTLDDESSRQLFLDKIMEMGTRFKNIILITHLEDVAEQFPNRIKVGRDKSGKSKILN